MPAPEIRPAWPLLAAALAVASFVAMDATVKTLATRYDALHLTFFRFASGSVFALALWLWRRTPLPRAAAWVVSRPPGVYDMQDVLGLR